MDGVCRAIGAPLPVEWRGKVRLVSPLRLADIGAIEHFMLSQMPSYMKSMLRHIPGIPESARDIAIRVAMEREKQLPSYIDPVMLQDFTETKQGAAMCWWLMLLRHHPRVTFESVHQGVLELNDVGFDKLLTDMALVSGISRHAERDWLAGYEDGDDLDRPSGTHKRFNWKYAVRKMCEAYMGMTPSDIGEMTLFTFREMYIEISSVKGRRIPRSEWQAQRAKDTVKE